MSGNVDRQYLELSDIVQYPRRPPSPRSEDILVWIEREYKSFMGFELGTFDPSILPTLFREQTVNWETLTMQYVSDIIGSVHRFCDEVLSSLFLEERIKATLWAHLLEELLPQYKRTVAHLQFVLETERTSTLLTTNHYFNENLEKSRLERLKAYLHDHTELTFGGSTDRVTVKLEDLVQTAGLGNLQRTAQDIHDILQAYYKVARKRFVDVICMQGTDYHVITGPDTPLRVFSAAYVLGLTSEQLEAIAGEDALSIQRRKALGKEIESLMEGRKILAT